MSRQSFGCCLLLSLATLAHAEMATRRWGTPPAGPAAKAAAPRAKPPTCYAVETKAPPEIDGTLDDAAWKAAQACQLARTLDGGGNAAQPTEVRLLHDAKMLYLAFRCTEPLLARLQASRRGHDGPIWEDDSVEFFIGLGGAYYHFGVNALGSTYDGKAKDPSWNSGLKAASGRERGAWTLEVAIPIASMAGQGKVPTEWTANFNRNRRATGNWEESAWSPTFSGDSHVPDRFGRMVFGNPPPAAVEQRPVVQRESITISPIEGGEGVVRFDLSDLPKAARVYRADLLVFQTTQVDGRMDEARIDIEIYPLLAAGGGPAGKPLALRPPWFDRVDATEAVRAAYRVPRAQTADFLVKACPFWDAKATCLDVWYEGKPEEVPPQAANLEAVHRAGQTFLTWKEIDDPVGRDDVTWGELKRIRDALDQKRRVRYCVYRSDQPIAAASLPEAELLAVIKPLSGWNMNGRNIDRPIDRVIATQEVLMVGHWSPFRDASVDGDFGRDCPIDRFVVREGDGPLPRGTGLYVHTAARQAKAYYAVLTSVDGAQNTRDVSSVGPVAETPAEPEPVLQGEPPKMPFFNYAEKRLHYVRWVAPPYCNLPSQYYNWSVGVPDGLGQGVPLELSLHRDGHSYWRTQYRIERDSIVLSPHDFPLDTWWYGYHEACGTLKSFSQGRIQPYTERRLLSFVDWACRKWPVDRNRILVTGCRGGAAPSGALHLGIRHPDVFNLAIAGHPVIDYAAASRDTSRWGLPLALSMQAVWGKADWDIKTDDGAGFWDQHDLLKVVAALPPTAALPYLTISSNHGYADCRKFYELLLTRHEGIMAEFSWGGARYVPVSSTGTYPNVIRLDIRRNKALLAFTSAQGLSLVTEGKMGDFNRHFRWRDLADEPDRLEATLFMQGRGDSVADVCPRRLQKLKVEKGKTYAWKCGGQSGEATVGDDGLLVLKGVKFTPEGARLAVRAK